MCRERPPKNKEAPNDCPVFILFILPDRRNKISQGYSMVHQDIAEAPKTSPITSGGILRGSWTCWEFWDGHIPWGSCGMAKDLEGCDGLANTTAPAGNDRCRACWWGVCIKNHQVGSNRRNVSTNTPQKLLSISRPAAAASAPHATRSFWRSAEKFLDIPLKFERKTLALWNFRVLDTVCHSLNTLAVCL